MSTGPCPATPAGPTGPAPPPGVRALLFELENSGLTVFLDNDYQTEVR